MIKKNFFFFIAVGFVDRKIKNRITVDLFRDICINVGSI